MADLKKYAQEEKQGTLKNEDLQKSDSFEGVKGRIDSPEQIAQSISEFGRISAARRKKRKNLPIIADVIIGILILAIAAGVIVGAYHLMRYYSDDYESVSVEYTFIAPCENGRSAYISLKNEDLYLDDADNTFYIGKIKNVDVITSESNDGTNNMLVLTVLVNAKYKSDEGYTVGGYRIAVGSVYTLRSETISANGTIVELLEQRTNGGES